MSAFANVVRLGLRSAQPAATSVIIGTLYFVTDEQVVERSNGTTWAAYSLVGVGSGDVIGPSASVASEVALFDGVTGKLIKRATGTGVAHLTAGVLSASAVVEADQTLADNTTANVSTAMHGYAPKAPNDATKFLNGANPPAWVVPAGGLVLLESRVAAASATLDFLARNAAGQSGATFKSDYDEYLIEFVSILPATAGVQPFFRFSQDGSTFDASTIYQVQGSYTFGSTGGGSTATQAHFGIVRDGNTTIAANTAYVATWRIFNPLSTSLWKSTLSHGVVYDNSIGPLAIAVGGFYKSTAAVVGFRVQCSSGDITSGVVRVYGVAK